MNYAYSNKRNEAKSDEDPHMTSERASEQASNRVYIRHMRHYTKSWMTKVFRVHAQRRHYGANKLHLFSSNMGTVDYYAFIHRTILVSFY